MKRLLTNAVIFAGGLMVSSQLLALGLGELKLESALSQPLKAEIELVDIKGLTEWDIKPSLASQEDFDRAGVDRVFFLTKIEFKVEGDRIVLTTRESINEPFLNFLIELNWPAGRVLREYTVLLDPPTYDEINYQPLVVTPEMQATETQLVVATPEEPVLVNKWSEPAEEGTYKVQPNDTLWAIALESRPATDITPQQMMLAIQEQNPQAFINGNINRLKSHHVLRIPDEQQIRSIGMAAAVAEVGRQNKALTTATAQYDATGRTGSMSGEQTSKSGGEVRLLAAKSEDAATAGTAGDVGEGSGVSRQALENDLAIALENVDSAQRNNEELSARLASLEDQIDTLQRLISLKDDELASLQADGAVAVVKTDTGTDDLDGSTQDFNFSEAEQEEGDLAEAAAQKAQAEAEEKARRERLDAILAEQAAQQDEKSIVDQLLDNPLIPAAAAVVLLLIVLLVARLLKKPKAIVDNNDDDPSDDSMLRDIELSEGSLDDFNFAEDEASDLQSFDQFDGDDNSFDNQASNDQSEGAAQTEDVITESDIYIAFGNFERAIQILKDAIKKEPQRSDLQLKLLEVYVETDDAQKFADTEAQLNGLGDAEASAEAANMRQRLSSPIEPELTANAEREVDNSIDQNNDLQAEDELESSELDLDLSAEFDEGLDFADALDLGADTSDVVSFDSKSEDIPTLEIDEAELEFEETPAATEKAKEVDNNDLDFSFDEETELAVPELDIESMELDIEEPAKQDDNSLDFSMDFDSKPETTETEAVSEESPAASESLDIDLESLDFDMESKDDSKVETLEFDVSDTDDIDGLDSLEDILDSKESSTDDLADLSFDIDDIADSDDLNLEETEELELPNVESLSADSELPDFSDDELEFDLGGSGSSDLEEEIDLSAPVSQPAQASTDEIDLDELAASENEFDFLAGTDECATKLDLARAYIDMEDAVGAKELLQEVIDEGSDQQKSEARELLANLA